MSASGLMIKESREPFQGQSTPSGLSQERQQLLFHSGCTTAHSIDGSIVIAKQHFFVMPEYHCCHVNFTSNPLFVCSLATLFVCSLATLFVWSSFNFILTNAKKLVQGMSVKELSSAYCFIYCLNSSIIRECIACQ